MSDFKTAYRRFATGRSSGWLSVLGACVLWPFSLVYRLLVLLRSLLFSCGLFPVTRAAVPVISVGNLSAGGTGKTPVVDHLVKRLGAAGRNVGIVSRGYGGRYEGRVALVADSGQLRLSAEQAGDEPVLLARRNPQASVAIAAKRIEGVRLLVERCGVDVVVLDDAFQHRAIGRDLDIVLLDGERPYGNGQMLPAGILREPVSALDRADLVILSRCPADCPQPERLASALRCRHEIAQEGAALSGGVVPFAQMQGKRIFAFAGIAEPEAFFTCLRDKGLTLTGTLPFPDHVTYSPSRLATLLAAAGDAELLLTTEKDAVKLESSLLPVPCYSVGVRPVFDDETQLTQALDRVLQKELDHD